MARNLPAALIAALTLLLAPAAQGAKKMDTYRSKDCGGKAVTWKIGYRLYWKDSEGRTIDRNQNEGFFTRFALQEAKQFAERVAAYSQCGVRVEIDVWDMEDTLWQAHDGQAFKFDAQNRLLPVGAPDALEFRESNDYDLAFFRMPRTYRERYSGTTQGRDVELPQQSNVPFGPSAGLLMHEFLHTAEFFYTGKIVQGFPKGGVHGSCNYRQHFPQCSEQVDEQFFAAFMRGEVPEGGGRFSGIRPAEWKQFGRPRAPGSGGHASQDGHLEPPDEPLYQPELRLERDGNVLIGDTGADGQVELTLYDAASGRLVKRRRFDGSFQLALTGGDYLACLYFPGDALFGAAQRCERVTVTRKLNRFLDVRRDGFGRGILTARRHAVGRSAVLYWLLFRCSGPVSNLECKERVVTRRIRLRRKQTIVAPKLRPRENAIAVDVEVREFRSGGVLWATTPGVGAIWVK